MVSNYIDNNCKYNLNKLVNVLYLVGEDAVKTISIDNGAAYISSVSQEPIEIKCYNLKLTENESLDERYKFTHTVTFSIHGYANKDNFQERYYVIVKDMDGTYWMLNPMFPCKVTYTYNLGNVEDHTDFTLATVSNHPILEVKGLDLTNTFECRTYTIGGIDKLWLNEKRFSVHEGNSVKYTNDGFKEVDFKRTTGLLTETFDGDKISHSINFKIGFDYYKTSWHYNLLEFIDNIYASVIKTKEGKYTLCGFGYGLQPSYTINADDTVGTPNTIEVTLADEHNDYHTLEFYDSIDYEHLSAKTWEYTSMYGGYECVAEGMAKYLLMKEIDALGNETGKYKCLYGYDDRFADLNIEGYFYDEVLFSSVDCGGMTCLIDLSFPSTIKFKQIVCKTYHLRCDTNWSITSNANFITVTPNSGVANQDYQIKVCNTLQPTATPRTAVLTVNYCDTAITYNAVVEEEGSACFPQGSVYEISANAQTLTIPTTCCVDEVIETSGVGAIPTVYENYITVQVPENNSGKYRTITLLVLYCDGKSSNIIIRQSDIFEEWVYDGSVSSTICIGYDEYRREYKYTGSTSSSITARTDEYRDVFVMANSPNCGYTEPIYRMFDTDEYICLGTSKYHVARQQISYNNGVSWEFVDPPVTGTGSIWEAQAEICGFRPSLPSWLEGIDYKIFGCSYDYELMYYVPCCGGGETINLPTDGINEGEPQTGRMVKGMKAAPHDGSTNIFYASYYTRYLYIGNCVTHIGANFLSNSNYYGYPDLRDLIIPNSVVDIGTNGLRRESNYTLVLGSGITHIGENGIYGWKTIIIDALNPPVLDGDTPLIPNVEIYVPMASVNLYKSDTKWGRYSDNIYGV